VPAAYVRLEILPLLPNGKLDRKALSALDTDAYTQQGYEEPQGEIEQRIAAVWADVLNLPVDRIGRHDNFFAIGGNSLRAVQVMRGLSEQVGYRSLSIQIMFENPMFKELASRLETPILSTEEWQSFARVLPLRASGTDSPLFCIHPIIGVGWAYAGLLPVIDSNRPIYAIQARGFEGESLPNSMEEMVSDYIAIIRSIQPSGPYHLCGWSFGGFVAHAIATQLQATNETVNFLGVLDTFFPNKNNQAPNADLHRMVRLLIVQSLLEFGIDKSSVSEVLINRILDVVGNNAALLSGYSPQKFAGKMLFVRATIISSRILGDLVSNRPLDHWGPYVTEAIECVDLEATHFTLLQGANGILVGEMFNAALASPSPDSTSINLKD
jgi:thioesterase domain-containing protein